MKKNIVKNSRKTFTEMVDNFSIFFVKISNLQ